QLQLLKQIIFSHMNSNQAASKPPYLLGLLGFIPLVGFFVGIGLTISGIFQYKSRKLIYIGISCMLFSVIVYSAIYYIGFRSEAGQRGWRQLAQMEMNSLIKDIEFYKLENGNYPDSLEQLVNKGGVVWISDPTQATQGRKNTNFNYKNLGDHY